MKDKQNIEAIIEAGEIYTADTQGNEVVLSLEQVEKISKIISQIHGRKGGWKKGRPRK